MQMSDAISLAFSRLTEFRGRSTRAEFWWFQLAGIAAVLFVATVDVLILSGVYAETGTHLLAFTIGTFWSLASIPIFVRRLHDVSLSAWWLFWLIFWGVLADFSGLFALIYIVLAVFNLIWLCTKSTDGENKYGEEADPTISEVEAT